MKKIITYGIVFVFMLQFLMALNVESLNPTIRVEMDEEYRPNTFNAYIENSGNKYEMDYVNDNNNEFDFFLKDDNYVPEGNYDFVLRYLDYDNSLKEKKESLDISRLNLILTVTNFKEMIENYNKYIYVNDLDYEIEFSSNVQISKYKLLICSEDALNCNVDLGEEIEINSNKFDIDLNEIGVEDNSFLQLKIRVYDLYNIAYDDYLYHIVIDESKPEITINYGENEIYDNFFNLEINASENVRCKYVIDDNFESSFFPLTSYQTNINIYVDGLGNDNEYDFKVICEDKALNEVEEEFTISTNVNDDNKILSILPKTYIGKDLKFTISTNRNSVCSYKVTGYDDDFKSISGNSKSHNVDISSYYEIDLLDEIYVFAKCNFDVYYGTLVDEDNKKFYLDFEEPVVSLELNDTYLDEVFGYLYLYDNFKIDECVISIDDEEFDCYAVGIVYSSKNNISEEFNFEYILENKKDYEVCLDVADGAGNSVKVCDNFIKDLNLAPEGFATCSDGVKNQDETDVDCGGSCSECELGNYCKLNSDCLEIADCIEGRCVINHCYNSVFDYSTETGLNCGGECSKKGLYCEVNDNCEDDLDCDSKYCSYGICTIPTCSDGVQNQDETDVDCGGVCSFENKTCEIGNSCVYDSDCETGVCSPLNKQCSEFTKEDLESQKEINEEEAIELGYKESPFSALLYVAIGFIILIGVSLGYYSYSHKEKNNFTSHSSVDQSRQKQSKGGNFSSFTSPNSNSGLDFNYNKKRNNELNHGSVGQFSQKNRLNIDIVDKFKEKAENIDKKNKINLKSLDLSKDSIKSMTKEELLKQIKEVKQIKEDIRLNTGKTTIQDIEEIKNKNRKELAEKEFEDIAKKRNNNKKDNKSKDKILSEEIENLLNENKKNKVLESEKLEKSENIQNTDKQINEKKLKKKTVFDELEDEIKDDQNVFDEIDKI